MQENTTEKKPFEIVIRTLSQEYLDHGGPAEQVIPCDGYMLHTTQDDVTQTDAQGAISQLGILKGTLRNLDNPLMLLAALLAEQKSEQPD